MGRLFANGWPDILGIFRLFRGGGKSRGEDARGIRPPYDEGLLQEELPHYRFAGVRRLPGRWTRLQEVQL